MNNDSRMGMIARASLVTGSATLIASAISLVRNRYIATLEGTEGVGLLGQFVSLQGLVAGIATLGLATGLIKYISQYLEEKEYEKAWKSFRSAQIMVVCSSVIAAVILVALSGWTSELLVGDDSARVYILIVAASIPMASLATVYNSFVNGAREIKALARITILSSLGALLFALPAVYFLGKEGVIVQIATASVVAFGLNYAASLRVRKNWPAHATNTQLDKSESRLLLHYGIVSIVTGLLLPLTLLVTQTAIIHQEGLSANGLFTASWSLFWLYIGFATTTVVVYLFPTMSATEDKSELSKQVNNGARFLAIATTPIACAIILMPGIILTILYSSDFTGAARLLQVMAVAGAFRIISFPISIALVAKKCLREYLPIELTWYLVFAGVSVVLLPSTGISAVGIAVLAAYIVHTVLFVFFVRRILGLTYSIKNWVILISSGVIVAGVMTIDTYSVVLSYVFAAISLVLWLFYATEKSERSWLYSILAVWRR